MSIALNEIFKGIVDGEQALVEGKKEALNSGESPKTILEQGMVVAKSLVRVRTEADQAGREIFRG